MLRTTPQGQASFHMSMNNIGHASMSNLGSGGGDDGGSGGGGGSRSNRMIASLRQELCQMRIRYEELEQESSYNAAKVKELQESIKASKPDVVHQALLEKSVQVAEVSMELDRLRGLNKKLETEKAKIQKLRDADRATIDDLNVVIRSLQSVSYASDSDDDGEGDEKKKQQSEPMTPEMALFKTLKNMKLHVEVLEDDRQRLAAKSKEHKATISHLKKEIELKDLEISRLERCGEQELVEKLEQESELKDMKIEMLEQLVRASVSGARAGVTPAPSATSSTMSSSSSSFDTNDAAAKAAPVSPQPDGAMPDTESTSQVAGTSDNNDGTVAKTVRKVKKSKVKVVTPGYENSEPTAQIVTPTSQMAVSSSDSADTKGTKVRRARRRRERQSETAASATTKNAAAEVARSTSFSLSPKPRMQQKAVLRSASSGDNARSDKQQVIVVNGQEATYVGPLYNGVPHGTGTLRFKNGDTYLGELENGKMHGKGTLYHRLGMSRGNFAHNDFLELQKSSSFGSVSSATTSDNADQQ